MNLHHASVPLLVLFAASAAACSSGGAREAVSSSAAALRTPQPGDTVYDVAITALQGKTIFHGHANTQTRPWDDDYVYLSVSGAASAANGGGLAYTGHYDDGTNELGRVTSGGTTAAPAGRFVVPALPILSDDRVAIAFSVDSRTSPTVASKFASAQPNEVGLMDEFSQETAANILFAYPVPPGPTDPFPLWHPIQDGFPQPFTPVGNACDGYLAKDSFLMDMKVLDSLAYDGASTLFTRTYDADPIACYADQNTGYTSGGLGWDNASAQTVVTFTVTRHDLPLPVFGPTCTPVLVPQSGAPVSAWLGTWHDTSRGGRSLVWATVAADPPLLGLPSMVSVSTDLASPGCPSHTTAASGWATIGSEIVSPWFTSDVYQSCSIYVPQGLFLEERGADHAAATERAATHGVESGIVGGGPFHWTVDEIALPNQTELTLYREQCRGWTGPYHVRYTRRDASGTPTTDVMLDAYNSPR